VRYPLEDHLSGMAVLTTSAGGVYVKESFDSFGKRRNPNSWSGAPAAGDMTLMRDASRRGFTLHEHLDNTALIHMNGRVQDPGIGRFLAADPFVPEPFDGQSFNRYSYVDNNPLSFIDPSGFDERVANENQRPKHHDYGNVLRTQLLVDWVEWLNWQQRDPVDRGSDPNAPPSEACDENNRCQGSVPQSTGGGVGRATLESMTESLEWGPPGEVTIYEPCSDGNGGSPCEIIERDPSQHSGVDFAEMGRQLAPYQSAMNETAVLYGAGLLGPWGIEAPAAGRAVGQWILARVPKDKLLRVMLEASQLPGGMGAGATQEAIMVHRIEALADATSAEGSIEAAWVEFWSIFRWRL
jgi:RHS repeat-associated protein